MKFGKQWPLLAIILLYWTTTIWLLILSIHDNQGRLIYPLDDSYIHMAIAKNVIKYNTWGTTQFNFTSSTSSPLWTTLLVFAYFMAGVNEYSPLILNFIAGTLLLVVINRILDQYIAGATTRFIVLSSILFVTPVPSLTISGMEHILHTLITVSFVYLIIQPRPGDLKLMDKSFLLILFLATVIIITRYEGAFLILTTCVVSILKRNYRLPIAISIAASLPVIFYGIWSTNLGWYFIPNSLLLKAFRPEISPAGLIEFVDLKRSFLTANAPFLITLLIMSILLFVITWRINKHNLSYLKTLNSIFIGTAVLHIIVASVGWFYRYEAYLIVLGILAVIISISRLMPFKQNTLIINFFILILLPFSMYQITNRAISAFRDTPHAMHDRHLEHVLPAKFINEYFPNSTIAVNDIGAISFYTENKILDIYGLGSLEPIQYQRVIDDRNYTQSDVAEWTRQENTEIAILQTQWAVIPPLIPQEWIIVSDWVFPRNVYFGNTKITFYATNINVARELSQSIKRFSNELPDDVTLINYYDDR